MIGDKCSVLMGCDEGRCVKRMSRWVSAAHECLKLCWIVGYLCLEVLLDHNRLRGWGGGPSWL